MDNRAKDQLVVDAGFKWLLEVASRMSNPPPFTLRTARAGETVLELGPRTPGKRPWMCCVLDGNVDVQLDSSSKPLRACRGQIVACLDRAADRTPEQMEGPESMSQLVSFIAHEGEVILLHLDDYSLFRRIFQDPHVVRLLRTKLVVSDPALHDPYIVFLRAHQPYLFNNISHWPDGLDISAREFRPHEHIIQQGKPPEAVFMIFRRQARIVREIGRHERFFHSLEPGALVGELERPLGGQQLFSLLSVKAGLVPAGESDRLFLGRANPHSTWTLRIGYEALQELVAANPQFDQLLEDYVRTKQATWWPMLTGPLHSAARCPPIAATLLKYAYTKALLGKADELPNKRPPIAPDLEAADPTTFDFRFLLLESCGEIDGDFIRDIAYPFLVWMRSVGVIELQWENEGRTDPTILTSKKSALFEDAQRMTFRIRNVRRLEELSCGIELPSRLQVGQAGKEAVSDGGER